MISMLNLIFILADKRISCNEFNEQRKDVFIMLVKKNLLTI